MIGIFLDCFLSKNIRLDYKLLVKIFMILCKFTRRKKIIFPLNYSNFAGSRSGNIMKTSLFLGCSITRSKSEALSVDQPKSNFKKFCLCIKWTFGKKTYVHQKRRRPKSVLLFGPIHLTLKFIIYDVCGVDAIKVQVRLITFYKRWIRAFVLDYLPYTLLEVINE